MPGNSNCFDDLKRYVNPTVFVDVAGARLERVIARTCIVADSELGCSAYNNVLLFRFAKASGSDTGYTSEYEQYYGPFSWRGIYLREGRSYRLAVNVRADASGFRSIVQACEIP